MSSYMDSTMRSRSIMALAGIITIFAFITGVQNLPKLFKQIKSDDEVNSSTPMLQEAAIEQQKRPIEKTNGISVKPTAKSEKSNVSGKENELVRGSVKLSFKRKNPSEAFSLITGTKVMKEAGDFYFYRLNTGAYIYMESEGSWITDLGPVDFEKLRKAPENAKDTSRSPNYYKHRKVTVGHTYCISLHYEKLFAKLNIINATGTFWEPNSVEFRYVFQTNGSRRFY